MMQFDDHIFQMDLNRQLDHVWILPGQYPFIFKYSSENDGLMWVSNIALAVFRVSQDGKTLEFRLSSKKGPHPSGGVKHVFFNLILLEEMIQID